MLLKRADRKERKAKSWIRKKRQTKRFGYLLRVLRRYCADTTLHGLKYIANTELNIVERLFWLSIFALSSFIVVRVILMLAQQFQAYPTSIGIETTNFKISGVPFPSVTICPMDQIDWSKLPELKKRIFSDTTNNQSAEAFEEALIRLSVVSFGDFDELSSLKKYDLKELAGINITEVLLDLMPTCQDLFSSCWWRSSDRNCCDIFELQKTEYGFCYSFNSEKSEPRLAGRDNSESRPRRVSSYGEWSGIRVTTHLGDIVKPPRSREMSGICLMIDGPEVWPNSCKALPTGSSFSVGIDCISGYASDRVLELNEDKIPCKYDKKRIYNQQACISFCRQAYVTKYCGCNLSFMFPQSKERDCNIEDFICLADNNDIFNEYYVLQDQNIADQKPAMICNCPPECDYYFYRSQITNVPIPRANDIDLDIHFDTQTSFRYKIDVIFTNLNLLIGFGSIIGLFLGGSLLSAVELIYYLIVILCHYASSWYPRKKREINVEVQPIATVLPKYPVLDYDHLESRLRQMPILLKGDNAKSTHIAH